MTIIALLLACYENSMENATRATTAVYCNAMGEEQQTRAAQDVDTIKACHNPSGEGTPCALRSTIWHACRCLPSNSASFRRIIGQASAGDTSAGGPIVRVILVAFGACSW